MKLGLLADIHEHTDHLRHALRLLQDHGADRFIVLGDIFESGDRLEETIDLLQQVEAVGVWGNHDYGLCVDPHDLVRRRFSPRSLDYLARLSPRLEVGDCLFTHVEPWLDTNKLEDLWWLDGPPDSTEKLARSFQAVPHRILFIGHTHCWLLGTPAGILPWQGEQEIHLDPANRYLVVVRAVLEGGCALFDTETSILVPFDLG